jgi:tetratricopeptide (TPR) repeat protein/uncharacterized protein YdbL (DUF1318 family)
MSEITLQEYQQKLEGYLQEGRNDEVVQHCRHILQYYPKNVQVYRQMGRALVESGRYTEAGEVFRRVLSVYPDDYHAHLGLSEVAQHNRKGEEAIWHLERAFEQDPNNAAILDNLRDLYRQYRNVEQTRFQLTARAVAAQQIRNGLYTQAIDTLQKALNQMPDRIDLKVLLGQVLWANHYNIVAAETALDVLKQIPDCLEANRILTELWLKEQRPSDAQRYLSRIEAVDPYLAFEIAQGAPPPDNAFRLAELDYQREASRQLVTDNPDWLASLEQVSDEPENIASVESPATSEEDDDWTSLFGGTDDATDEEADPLFTLDLHDEEMEDVGADTDWMQALEDVQPSDTPQRETDGLKNTGLTGLLSSLGDRSGSTGLTGLLNTLDDDDSSEQSEAEDDWMQALNKPTAPLQDPNALTQTSTLPDVPELDEDPLDWLNTPEQLAQTGGLSVNDDDEEEAADPLAWMRDSGIEYLEDAPARVYNPTLDDDDDRPFFEPTENNPMAWMQSAGIEMVDEEEWDDSPVKTDDLPSNDADPLAWMRDAGIEFLDTGDDNDGESTVELPDRGTIIPGTSRRSSKPLLEEPESENNQDKLDWLSSTDQLDELLTLETMAETGSLTGTGALEEQDEDMAGDNNNDRIPDWLTSDDDDDDDTGSDLEWLSSTPQGEDNNALDWMAESEADDEDDSVPSWLSASRPNELDETEDDLQSRNWDVEPAEASNVPDWLSSVAPSQPPAVDVGNLFGNDEEEETVPGDAAVPDWLSAVSPTGGSTIDEDDTEFDFMLEETDEDEFDFTSEDEDEQAAVGENVPDWLSAVSPTSSTTQAEEDEFDFTLEDEDEQAAVGENVPDWLSAVSPTSGTTQEEEDEFDFTLEDEDEQAGVGENVPDWLSAVSPTSSTTQAEEDEFDFTLEDEDEQAAVGENVPDWLSAVSPTSSATQAEEDEFDFTLEDEDEQAAVGENVPDWLSAVSPTSGTTQEEEDEFDFTLEDEDEQAAVGENVPDWLSAVSPTSDTTQEEEDEFDFTLEDEDEQAAVGENVPDWLSAVSPTAGTVEEEDEFDFTLEDEDEQAAVGENVPDWLSAVSPTSGTTQEEEDEFDFTLEDEDEAVAEDNVPDWLSAVSPTSNTNEDEFEFALEDEEEVDYTTLDEEADYASLGEEVAPTPAANAPDWLNAMVPGLDLDYDEDEETEAETTATPEPSRAGDFGWLTTIVNEELAPPTSMPEPVGSTERMTAVVEPTQTTPFVFSRPPLWLRRLRGEENNTTTMEDDDDLPPWLAFDDDDPDSA